MSEKSEFLEATDMVSSNHISRRQSQYPGSENHGSDDRDMYFLRQQASSSSSINDDRPRSKTLQQQERLL